MKFKIPDNIAGFEIPKINYDKSKLMVERNRIIVGYESPDVGIDISEVQKLRDDIADAGSKKFRKFVNDLKEDNKDVVNELQPMYPYVKEGLTTEYEKYKSMNGPEAAVALFKDLIGLEKQNDKAFDNSQNALQTENNLQNLRKDNENLKDQFMHDLYSGFEEIRFFGD